MRCSRKKIRHGGSEDRWRLHGRDMGRGKYLYPRTRDALLNFAAMTLKWCRDILVTGDDQGGLVDRRYLVEQRHVANGGTAAGIAPRIEREEPCANDFDFGSVIAAEMIRKEPRHHRIHNRRHALTAHELDAVIPTFRIHLCGGASQDQ